MSKRQWASVQEMLDDIAPELGKDFVRYQRRPLVRLRKWFRLWVIKRRAKRSMKD